jgi:hypothetical protein
LRIQESRPTGESQGGCEGEGMGLLLVFVAALECEPGGDLVEVLH